MPKANLNPKIFRDYDIRAIYPDDLNEEGIKQIARAIIKIFSPKKVQIGRDMRVSSPKLHNAFTKEFLNYGVDVVDLGLISTDMLYFTAGKYNEDLAITVSASHNPPEYNGLKLAKKGAIAIAGDTGIYDIRDTAIKNPKLKKPAKRGQLTKRNIMNDWIKHLLTFIKPKKMKPLRVAIDTGNGMAGHFMPELEKHLPWKVDRMYYKLDGTFPNHIPSPIEAENMQDVVNKVKETNADLGMAFDGDGDRVFLVDELGEIVSGTVMTAIIAENLLQKSPGETVLYNAIVGRIVPQIIQKYNGKPVRVRVGHSIIKKEMRKNNGLFCGEHSGHYYFRDNFYADSAIIAALLVTELMSERNKKLSELVAEYDKYESSGEINFKVEDKEKIMNEVENDYKKRAEKTDRLDGISVWFNDYWFNIRPSNTEPLLRLNIEADNQKILKKIKKELVGFIESKGGKMT